MVEAGRTGAGDGAGIRITAKGKIAEAVFATARLVEIRGVARRPAHIDVADRPVQAGRGAPVRDCTVVDFDADDARLGEARVGGDRLVARNARCRQAGPESADASLVS